METTTMNTSAMGINECVTVNAEHCLTAIRMHADRDIDGAAMYLEVVAEETGIGKRCRTTGRWIVSWASRTTHWHKRHNATFTTREAATSFAREKWGVMVDILGKRKQVRAADGGAAAAFSASLGGMVC